MRNEHISDEKSFESSNLPLAAALLVSVPEIMFDEISSVPGVDGRRVIKLRYPKNREADLRHVVEDFHRRTLDVKLYLYNKVLNSLRDCLHQNDHSKNESNICNKIKRGDLR